MEKRTTKTRRTHEGRTINLGIYVVVLADVTQLTDEIEKQCEDFAIVDG